MFDFWGVGKSDSEIEDEYRTKDGRAYFIFRFLQLGKKGVEIEMVKGPGGRKTGFGEQNQQQLPSNLKEARQVAAHWAETVWKEINSDTPNQHEREITMNDSHENPVNTGKRYQEMRISQSTFDNMCDTVGRKRAETGGILLGTRSDYGVQKFVFDPHGSQTAGGYDPDVNYLNKIIKKEWEENQLELVGFLHSHPRGVSRLSGDWGNNIGDLGYIKAIFKAIPALEQFLVPIMYSRYDGGELVIFPYIAPRRNPQNYQKASRIVNEHGQELDVQQHNYDRTRSTISEVRRPYEQQ